MKSTGKLENTRFQIKRISEFAPVKSNVKYAQRSSADIEGIHELDLVRSNVKYAQIAGF